MSEYTKEQISTNKIKCKFCNRLIPKNEYNKHLHKKHKAVAVSINIPKGVLIND